MLFKTYEEPNVAKFEAQIELIEKHLLRLRRNQLEPASIAELIEDLKQNLTDTGFYTLGDLNEMPSDARFYFAYLPTCIASSMMMELITRNHPSSPDLLKLLDQTMPVIVERRFMGHGYGRYRGFLKCLTLFDKDTVAKFLQAHRRDYSPFAHLWRRVPMILREIMESDFSWMADEAEKKEAARLLEQLSGHKKYYIAYGSNMDVRRMRSRCPDSEFVATAVLDGYKLNFRDNGGGNCYATLDKSIGDSTPVVIWRISRQDEIKLDRYEGVRYDCYYKTELSLKLNDSTISGLCYLVDERRPAGRPPADYADILKRAYQNFAFNETDLLELIQ